jgi:MFS family permease
MRFMHISQRKTRAKNIFSGLQIFMNDQQRRYLSLCATGFFLYFSYALSRSPIVPLYAKSLGASSEIVGWTVAASTIAGMLMKLPAGTLSDIFGRRALLLVGASVFALAPFFYPLIATVAGLMALRFIHGHATAIFGPTASAAISDFSAPNERGIRLGFYASVQGIGQTLGPLLGGFLISWQGFKWPFLISGLLGVAGLLLFWISPIGMSLRERKHTTKNFLQGWREVAGNRGIIMTSVAVASQMFTVGAYNAFLPLYAKEIAMLEAWHIGAIFGAQTTTTLLARPLLGKFSDRFGRRPIILAALVWCALLIALLPQFRRFEALLCFGVTWGFGTAVVSSVASAFITDLAKRAHYGAAHGAFGTIFDFGEAAGPIVAGMLVAQLGYAWMFAAVAVQLLLMAAVFAAIRFEK